MNLIHLTTADLSDLADGKSDIEAFRTELERTDSYILITRYHLLEWLTLAPDSVQRRLFLPDHLARVAYCGQSNHNLWSTQQVQLCFLATKQKLITEFYVEEHLKEEPPQLIIMPDLLQERNDLVSLGEEDFFARNSRRASKDEPIESKAFDKYMSQNRKHGSDISIQWEKVQNFTKLSLKYAPKLQRLIPNKLKDVIKSKAGEQQKKLYAIEPSIHARTLGIQADHPIFKLYWDVRRRIRSNQSEQGGLGEQVDLYELSYLQLSRIWSADKRVAPNVIQAIKSLDEVPDSWQERVIRCGKKGTYALAALNELPTVKSPLDLSQFTEEE